MLVRLISVIAVLAGLVLVAQPLIETLIKDTTEEATAKRARTFRTIRMVLSGIIALGIIFLLPFGSLSIQAKGSLGIAFCLWAIALAVDAASKKASASATAIGLNSAGILVLLLAAGASKYKSGSVRPLVVERRGDWRGGQQGGPVPRNWQNDEQAAQAMMDEYMDSEQQQHFPKQRSQPLGYGSYIDVDI